jgi:hypothetical protein
VKHDIFCGEKGIQECSWIVHFAHGALERVIGCFQPFLEARLVDGDASFAAAALRLEQLTVFLEANVARHEYEVIRSDVECVSFRERGRFQFFFDKKIRRDCFFRSSASP